jgi:hypothetical protein
MYSPEHFNEDRSLKSITFSEVLKNGKYNYDQPAKYFGNVKYESLKHDIGDFYGDMLQRNCREEK